MKRDELRKALNKRTLDSMYLIVESKYETLEEVIDHMSRTFQDFYFMSSEPEIVANNTFNCLNDWIGNNLIHKYCSYVFDYVSISFHENVITKSKDEKVINFAKKVDDLMSSKLNMLTNIVYTRNIPLNAYEVIYNTSMKEAIDFYKVDYSNEISLIYEKVPRLILKEDMLED